MPPTPQPISPQKLLITRVLMVSLCVAGALASGFYGQRHARSYMRMGKQPEEITAAQAFDVPLDGGPRWVRLKEPLTVNCDRGLQQIKGSNVEFTEYLAYDATGKYAFLVQYKGDSGCAGTASIQGEGLLKSPPMYWWTMNNMPAPNSDPVELKLDAQPKDEFWEAVYAFALFAVAAVFAAVFALSGRKPKSPQQQFQEKAAASGR